jgi:hypothetical protein
LSASAAKAPPGISVETATIAASARREIPDIVILPGREYDQSRWRGCVKPARGRLRAPCDQPFPPPKNTFLFQ